MPDEKKVDESWKEQAKPEKAPGPAPHSPAPKRDEGPASAPAPKRAEGSASVPPADFSSLIASLATGALMALGGDEEEGKPGAPDLPRAKYAIDLLDVLSVKTKGNLSPDEGRHLAAILHQLRMAYVEASRKKS
jgi:hypothetical protein